MKKIIQDKNGLREVDSNVNPEYFNSEELQGILLYKNTLSDKDKIDVIAQFLNLK